MDGNMGESPHEKTDIISEPPFKTSYKSFRRKYRKIMVKFEDRMRESNTLFRERQRVLDISHRLSEQNDQLLELLYDLNQAPQIMASHRYDLQPPTTASYQPADEDQEKTEQFDSNIAPTALREARQGLKLGRMTIADYHRVEESLLKSGEFKPQKSYASLLELPHASVHDTNVKNDAADTVINGFPAPWEEARYLEALDYYLDGSAPTARPSGTAAARSADRSVEKDREMALQNPVSVYNWLRKHQPQVFLQDNEVHAEKVSARLATSRASKRASTVKQEPDLYDEDGIAIDVGSSSRGKRKRDDDGGYRPKGGNGRPLKRKKEDGSASAKKSKRASISG